MIESGTHAQLLSYKGVYAKLWMTQANLHWHWVWGMLSLQSIFGVAVWYLFAIAPISIRYSELRNLSSKFWYFLFKALSQWDMCLHWAYRILYRAEGLADDEPTSAKLIELAVSRVVVQNMKGSYQKTQKLLQNCACPNELFHTSVKKPTTYSTLYLQLHFVPQALHPTS